MLKIIQYNILTLSRFKMAKYQLIPEYLGLIAVIVLSSLMFTGISCEEIIVDGKLKYMNFNILALYFFLAPILSDVFMYNFYDINYKYFKLLYPFKSLKIIFIDMLLELLSYKLFFILFFVILYIPFCITYDLTFIDNKSLKGFCLIVSMYINACLFVRLIKDIGKDMFFKSYKNYLKLFLVFIVVLLVVNENTKTFTLSKFETAFFLLYISFLSLIVLSGTLYLINIKNDRI